jgi:hypothetical protein
VPGKLGGTASITAGLDSWEQATGKADLKLSESDLVNLSVIGAVYDSLHFLAKTTPTGTGNVSLRLEGTQLVVVRMGYFNRGMDVVGHGTVKDLRLGRDSPVDAFVVGAVRPLKNVNWLILRDIEKVMANLQADAAAFRVSGTVADPKPKSMPLAELVGAFQRQVLGKDKP